jgi:hypothetical protein
MDQSHARGIRRGSRAARHQSASTSGQGDADNHPRCYGGQSSTIHTTFHHRLPHLQRSPFIRRFGNRFAHFEHLLDKDISSHQ